MLNHLEIQKFSPFINTHINLSILIFSSSFYCVCTQDQHVLSFVAILSQYMISFCCHFTIICDQYFSCFIHIFSHMLFLDQKLFFHCCKLDQRTCCKESNIYISSNKCTLWQCVNQHVVLSCSSSTGTRCLLSMGLFFLMVSCNFWKNHTNSCSAPHSAPHTFYHLAVTWSTEWRNMSKYLSSLTSVKTFTNTFWFGDKTNSTAIHCSKSFSQWHKLYADFHKHQGWLLSSTSWLVFLA